MAKQRRNAQAGAKNMKTFYTILAIVAVIGVAAIVYATTRSGDMATEPLDMTQIGDASALLERAQGVTVGPEDAPVQILVFSDYMCPGCAHWANAIEPFLKPEFVQPGAVRYTYYDFPLPGHTHSFIASRAARCAGDQNRFWEYHDRLFGQQNQWSYSASTPTNLLVQYAQDVGIDTRAFQECLRSDRHAEVVTANKLLGETLGVNATPSVYVNGRRLGNNEWQDYARVRAAVQAAGAPAAGADATGS